MFQATSYLYIKPAKRREMDELITDQGLVAAGGEIGLRSSVLFQLTSSLGAVHKRQRKCMMPAFGQTASRELLPRFIEVVDKAS